MAHSNPESSFTPLSGMPPIDWRFHRGPPPRTGETRTWPASELDPAVNDGDLVTKFGHSFTWNDKTCLRGKELERWRSRGDKLADDCIDALREMGTVGWGKDSLEALLSAEDTDERVKAMLDNVRHEPRQQNGQQWDSARLRHGQDFFWKNVIPITLSLLHYSLAAGFASPRITPTLARTGYLIGKQSDGGQVDQRSSDRTNRRLLETTVWIMDVMADDRFTCLSNDISGSIDAAKISGEGWRSTIRVRLLHAQIRQRLRKQPGESELDLPINQEDLLATLGSFSVAPIISLDRMSMPPSQSEREDFIYLWRYLGHFLGCDPVLVDRHFASFDAAQGFLASVTLHLIDVSKETTLTRDLLGAMANRPPGYYSMNYHSALTRYLLNDPLADHFRLPKSSLLNRCRLVLQIAFLQYSWHFGHFWPAWEQDHADILKAALPMTIEALLKRKRTRFIEKDWSKEAQEIEQEPFVGDGPPFRTDITGKEATAIRRRYRWVMVRLFGSLAAVTALPIVSTWLMYRLLG